MNYLEICYRKYSCNCGLYKLSNSTIKSQYLCSVNCLIVNCKLFNCKLSSLLICNDRNYISSIYSTHQIYFYKCNKIYYQTSYTRYLRHALSNSCQLFLVFVAIGRLFVIRFSVHKAVRTHNWI